MRPYVTLGRRGTLEERFECKYEPEPMTGCWLWTAGVKEGGYGLFRIGDEMQLAHRVSWELRHGRIRGGNLVLHRCDTPPCVNPAHLFLGDWKDNVADAVAKGRMAFQREERN